MFFLYEPAPGLEDMAQLTAVCLLVAYGVP